MKFYSLLQGKLSACQTHQVLRVMKLTFVLLTVALLQVSAASHAQKVTLNAKAEPLSEIFKTIRQQTGLNFVYDMKLMEIAKPVTLQVKDANLADVLHQCFIDQPFTYELDNKTIIVKEKQIKAFSILKDTSIRVGGKVVNEKGEGLGGATVLVKGTTYLMVVGSSGAFSIVLPSSDAVLVVSYIGYKTKEVTISGADVDLVIHMEPAVGKLKDVDIVSTGYYDIPKERATGSFEVLTAKQLNMVTGTDIVSRLNGNVTSLNINPQLTPTSSSDPNKVPSTSNLTIRGGNSFGRNTTTGGLPLFVVDGVALEDNDAVAYSTAADPLANMNPNDIESVIFLKDAAAASIWGSRAANGVVVIVTKKGKYNTPMQVSVNSNITVTEKPNLFYYKRASTADFIDVQKTLYKNGFYDGTLSYADYADYNFPQPAVPGVVEILEQQKNGQITADQANAQLAALGQNDVRKDITKYILRNAVNQSHSISIIGGSQDIAYHLSGGYDNDLNNTILSGSNRLTLSSSTTIKVNKNFSVQTNIDYSQNNRSDQSVNNFFQESGNAAHYGYMVDPYTRLVDSKGNPVNVIKDYRPEYVMIYSI